MPLTKNNILSEAMSLPKQDRAYLAEKLIESLDFDDDIIMSEEWKKEIAMRLKNLDVNSLETADKVFADAFEKFK